MTKQIMTIVRGEPFLSRVKAYHEEYIRVVDEMTNFMNFVGAETFWCFPGSNKLSLKFKRQPDMLRNGVPEGYYAPDRRTGATSPKKNTPVYEQMMQLPLLPTTRNCFEGIPTKLGYRDPLSENYGYSSLVNNTQGFVGWEVIDGEFMYFMEVPDIDAAKTSKREQYENVVFDDEVTNWKMPEALEPITKVKYKYLQALAALQEEENPKT